jgi:hypothetical protein
MALISAKTLLFGGLFCSSISALNGAQRLDGYQNDRLHSSAVHSKSEIAGRFAASARGVAEA